MLIANEAITELNRLIESGEFHHATFRQQGSRTDLYIYRKDSTETGFRGYKMAKVDFSSWDAPEIWAAAQEAVSNTGYSVGSYGRG